MTQVAWGSWGANQLDLRGQVGNHHGSALIKWAADGGEAFSGWWSKVKRTVKKTARSAKPFVTVGAVGASLIFPPAAPLAGGIVAAVKVIDKAEKGNKKARAIIRGTTSAAKAASASRPARRAERADAAGGRWPRSATIRGTIAFAGDESGAERAHKTLRAVAAKRKLARARGQRIAFVVDRTGHVHRVL